MGRLPVILQWFFSAAAFVLAGLPEHVMANNQKLADIHADILKKYPAVSHISADTVALASEDVLYFDVRKPKEHAVSHLRNAIQVDPAMTPEAFDIRFGESIDNKTLIFYCSVGRRASRLINRLQPLLEQTKSSNAFNLEGGIFRWHNDQRPLFQNTNSTEKVHPYNWFLSRLLLDRDSLSYKP